MIRRYVGKDENGNDIFEDKYVGATLFEYVEHDYYCSYFDAIVWDAEDSTVKRVPVDYDNRCASCTIDATEPIVRSAKAWLYKKIHCALRDHDTARISVPCFGRRIRVVNGRKVPKGTEGIVFWSGETYNRFTHGHEQKVGIRTDSGDVHFILQHYVEVIEPEQYRMKIGELVKKVREWDVKSIPRLFSRYGMLNYFTLGMVLK